MLGHQIVMGDKKLSFKELFRDYYPSLLHFAFQILKNRHDAEDIVQDVFMNMWRTRPTFENETAMKAWLYMVTRNRALDVLKKKSPVYTDVSAFEQLEQEVDLIVKEEAFRLLDAAIEQLPDRTREVIRLSLDNYSVKEVAEKLNITVNTVKTLKSRAYKFLKEQCCTGLLLLFLALTPSSSLHEQFRELLQIKQLPAHINMEDVTNTDE